MNDAVKKRLEQLRKLCERINAEADYISEDLIEQVEESEDLPGIEMAFDNIERWAKEAYDICRNTYDEFEEEEND